MAQMNSPKKQHFYSDIARVEWLFGASLPVLDRGRRPVSEALGVKPCSA